MGSSRLYSVSTNGTTGVSGVTTAWLIKQATRSLVIAQVSVSFGGAAPGGGLLVQLNAYSGALPGTGTSQTPGKVSDMSMAAADATAEVAGTSVPSGLLTTGPQWYVQPFGGILDLEYPLKREPGLEGGTAAVWGLVITNLAIAYPFAGYVLFEES